MNFRLRLKLSCLGIGPIISGLGIVSILCGLELKSLLSGLGPDLELSYSGINYKKTLITLHDMF